MTNKQIKQAIINNGYVLPNFRGNWCASSVGWNEDGSTRRSTGIFKLYSGRKFYFYIIQPWAGCPGGDVTVEDVK